MPAVSEQTGDYVFVERDDVVRALAAFIAEYIGGWGWWVVGGVGWGVCGVCVLGGWGDMSRAGPQHSSTLQPPL